MNNDYQENKNIKEQIFKTKSGKEVSWSTLLLVKGEILLATGEEITLQQALIIADCFLTVLNENK